MNIGVSNKLLYRALLGFLVASFFLGILLVLNGDSNAKADVWFVPIILIQILAANNYIKEST